MLGGSASFSTSYHQGDAAGTSETVSVGGLTDSNYAITIASGSFTVAQKALTVTATGLATYGDAAATVGYATSGFVLNESSSVLGVSASFSTSYHQGDNAGTSETVSVSGLTDSNYAITFASGSFTVAQKALTVTATGSATPRRCRSHRRLRHQRFRAQRVLLGAGGQCQLQQQLPPGRQRRHLARPVSVSGLTDSNYAITFASVHAGHGVAQKALTVTGDRLGLDFTAMPRLPPATPPAVSRSTRTSSVLGGTLPASAPAHRPGRQRRHLYGSGERQRPDVEQLRHHLSRQRQLHRRHQKALTVTERPARPPTAVPQPPSATPPAVSCPARPPWCWGAVPVSAPATSRASNAGTSDGPWKRQAAWTRQQLRHHFASTAASPLAPLKGADRHRQRHPDLRRQPDLLGRLQRLCAGPE